MNNDNLEIVAWFIFGIMVGITLTVAAFILGVHNLIPG